MICFILIYKNKYVKQYFSNYREIKLMSKLSGKSDWDITKRADKISKNNLVLCLKDRIYRCHVLNKIAYG